jgi:hypothetical protein
LTVDLTELDFDKVKVGKTSQYQAVTVSGEDLTGYITWYKGGTDAAAFKVTETSWNSATGGTLDITFSPTTEKVYNAYITISSAGATSKTITLKGQGIIPNLIVTPTELNFNDVIIGTTSSAQTITISGTNLIGEIAYMKDGNDAATFNIDETAWDPITGGTLDITFSPTEEKVYNAYITIYTSTESETITVTGKGIIEVAIDETDLANITIYPNPTNGELTITTSEYPIFDIRIYDVMGREVQSLKFKVQRSEFLNFKPETLNISYLPAGIYFVRIQTENEVIMKKVVKM